ncbi:MAG TPA: N-acetylmuramoyl-L-alanine amidase [Lacunisphaera sp.]|nr:N-acetylmuramoyl-L-alanine amidase [Lacunisphaera sp.]
MNRRGDAVVRLMARGLLVGFAIGLICFALPAPAAPPTAPLVIEELARHYGLKGTRINGHRTLRLQSQWTTLEFTAGSREASWNGIRLFLGEPVQAKGRSLQLARSDWLATVRPLLDPKAGPAPGRLGLIVLDPGHGGNDPGTENRAFKYQEKTFTLDVAQRLQRDLERRGYRVALTRTSDVRLKRTQAADLRERAERANRQRADLFVSIHFNALSNQPKVHGVETYTLTPAGQRSTAAPRRTIGDSKVQPGNRHDHWNTVLAGALHRSLLDRLGAADRGLKRARWGVLRPVNCPAVLVEAGFLSNRAEAAKIGTAAYRQQIAEALGEGIGAYHALLREAAKN